MPSTFSFRSQGCPSTMLCAKSLAADIYKPPTGVVTLRRQCGRDYDVSRRSLRKRRTAVRKGYDTNEEQSTMGVCVARRCYTGSDPSRRLVPHSLGDGGRRTIEAWLLGEDLPSQPGNIAEIPTVALQPFLRSQLSPQHVVVQSAGISRSKRNLRAPGGGVAK